VLKSLGRSLKTAIIKLLERLLGRQIARRTPDRGADLFANIDQIYGKNNLRVVLDVGANVGQTTSVYRREFPYADIYSFEPVSTTFHELTANSITLSGVHLFQMGFGSQASSATISLGEDSRMNSIVYRVGEDSEIVEIQTLDEFVTQHNIDLIDFLKIDTEGYELEVLKGGRDLLRNQRIGMIYIEAELMQTTRHFVPVEEINGALREYGYEIFGVYEQQPHWTGEHSILFCNVLYVAPGLIPRHINPNCYPFRTAT